MKSSFLSFYDNAIASIIMRGVIALLFCCSIALLLGASRIVLAACIAVPILLVSHNLYKHYLGIKVLSVESKKTS